jgi:uncharacterized protein YlaN (UPF0358 family)
MSKQKIQIMVEPHTFAVLKELSYYLGEPLSPMVNSMLEALLPGLETSLNMAKEARKMDEESKKNMVNELEKVLIKLESNTKESLEQAEEIYKKVH